MSFASHFLTFVVGGSFGAFVLSGTPPPEPKAPPPAMVNDSVDTVLTRHDNGHFFVDAMVNGQLVHFVVDTGASGVALTVADAVRVGLVVNPEKFEVVGMGASGPVRGTRVVLNSVAIGNKEASGVGGAILEGSDISLLGQSFLSRIGSVRIVEDKMILR
jgi:aspartyl protease family protein